MNPASEPTMKEYFNILILGGSQGSKQLNEIVLKAFKDKIIPSHWRIVHQIGDLDKSPIVDAYSKQSFIYEVVAYIEDIGRAYHESDLVIGRSGAMTVSEICCSSKPSILFPLPWAADNHQYFNAKFLKDKKASILLESSLDNAGRLFTLLIDLEKDHNARHSMSLNAFDAFPVSSGNRIVEIINESF
jgi:UDP-N-acetylglucosamine--N-acetylmuramyl-(pentapeptide) pyrophosphoryl-undecaprenol N-acetylglucosamine transferase